MIALSIDGHVVQQTSSDQIIAYDHTGIVSTEGTEFVGGLWSPQEQIDTTSAAGRLFFHMMGALALAVFERNLFRERPQAGLAAAKRRGK